jgi:hypothetical protein
MIVPAMDIGDPRSVGRPHRTVVHLLGCEPGGIGAVRSRNVYVVVAALRMGIIERLDVEDDVRSVGRQACNPDEARNVDVDAG